MHPTFGNWAPMQKDSKATTKSDNTPKEIKLTRPVSRQSKVKTLNLDLNAIKKGLPTSHTKRNFTPESPKSPSDYRPRSRTRLSEDSNDPNYAAPGVRDILDNN